VVPNPRDASGAASAQEEPLRIGVNLWVGYDLLAVAEQQGLFAAHGVEVEIVDFTSLGDVVAAYRRGQIDGMATSINEVLQVRSEGFRDPQIVLMTEYSAGADVIVAADGIKSVADLTGKRVLVEPPLGSFILALALRSVGLSLDDVQLVLVNQVEMPSVVAAGGADAAVGFPPVSLDLEDDFGYQQIFTTAQISGQVVDVVSLDSATLQDRPQTADALRRAWDDAVELLASDPVPTIEAMANREAIGTEEMALLLGEVELITWAQQSAQFEQGSVDLLCLHAAQVMADLGLISDATAAFGCAAREPG
jgi:NitT/TauT family transport system substrate-binding protein